MKKPEITKFERFAEITLAKYERYLPTAFDESLTLLEKMNKLIQYLNEMGLLLNDVVENWNKVMEWVMNDGLTQAISDKLDEMVEDGTLDNIINHKIFNELNERVNNNTEEINRLNKLYVSAEKFNVVGDGVADDSAALQNAIDFCELTGATLFFPKGYKMSVFGIEVKCNMYGGTFISNKGFNSGQDVYNFVRVIKPVEIKNSIFDGNVSSDPDVWTNENFNSFEGVVSLMIASDNVSLINVTAKNSFRSNFRIEGCKNVTLINCISNKSRGNFGDGYYMANSNNVTYINCKAYDFTRIGFVSEGGGNVSHDNVWDECYAENGHNQSSNFTDGYEFNAGFWSENSGENKFINCVANDTGSRGFVISSQAGSQLIKDVEVPRVTLTGCKSLNAYTGFSLTSQANNPIIVTLNDCYASTVNSHTLNYGYSITVANKKSKVTLNNCFSRYGNNAVNGVGFNIHSPENTNGRGVINLNNCTVSDMSNDQTYKKATNSNAGDVSSATGLLNVDLNINDLRSNSTEYPIIKFRHSQTGEKISIRIKNSKVFLFGRFKKLYVDNCNLLLDDILTHGINSDDITIKNTTADSPLSLVSNKKITITDSHLKHLSVHGGNTKEVSLLINNTHFKDDMTDKHNNLLRVQYENTNKGRIMLSNSSFINTGDTVETPSVWLVREGTKLYGSNVLYDNSITKFIQTATLFVNPDDFPYAIKTNLK